MCEQFLNVHPGTRIREVDLTKIIHLADEIVLTFTFSNNIINESPFQSALVLFPCRYFQRQLHEESMRNWQSSSKVFNSIGIQNDVLGLKLYNPSTCYDLVIEIIVFFVR